MMRCEIAESTATVNLMTSNSSPPHPLANIGGDSHCVEAGNVLVPSPASLAAQYKH